MIAIIAILSALLFPAVTSSLNSGRTAASISNLKQIHLLFVNYTSDNNGAYPISIENPDLFWRRVVWEHTHGPFEGGPVEVMEAMQASDYSRIMWCPAMMARFGQEQHPGGRGSYQMKWCPNRRPFCSWPRVSRRYGLAAAWANAGSRPDRTGRCVQAFLPPCR